MRRLLLSSLLLGGCTPSPPPPPTEPPAYAFPSSPLCTGTYAGTPTVLGQLGDARLIEISGVVPSPTTPDLLWVHNDSGDDAAIYAIHRDGRLRGRLRLPVAVDDVEDIDIATCPDKSGPCIYLADTGNNAGDRTDTAIFIFAEPLPRPDGTFAEDAVVNAVQRIDASATAGLPAGIDIEAMAVLPDGETVLLIEKVDADLARIFALTAPLSSSVASEVGSVRTESPSGVRNARMVTAAVVHPGGLALLVRTYTGIFESRFATADDTAAPGDLTTTTVTFGPFSEPQGEAVSYDQDGAGILSISEANGGAAADIAVNLLACQ